MFVASDGFVLICDVSSFEGHEQNYIWCHCTRYSFFILFLPCVDSPSKRGRQREQKMCPLYRYPSLSNILHRRSILYPWCPLCGSTYFTCAYFPIALSPLPSPFSLLSPLSSSTPIPVMFWECLDWVSTPQRRIWRRYSVDTESSSMSISSMTIWWDSSALKHVLPPSLPLLELLIVSWLAHVLCGLLVLITPPMCNKEFAIVCSVYCYHLDSCVLFPLLSFSRLADLVGLGSCILRMWRMQQMWVIAVVYSTLYHPVTLPMHLGSPQFYYEPIDDKFTYFTFVVSRGKWRQMCTLFPHKDSL